MYVDSRGDTRKPFYVGKGSAIRCLRLKRNKLHTNIAKKHGVEREIVFQTSCEQTALEHEKYLIKELATRDYQGGANFTDGGDGVSGFKHSLISNKRNADRHVGIVQSDDTCSLKSQSMLESPLVKRKRVKQFLSDGTLVMIHDSITAAARSIGSPNSATLISRCCRGKTSTFANFKWEYVDKLETNDMKKPRSHAVKKSVQQIDFSGRIVAIHPSINVAARSIGKNSVSIRLCCHDTRSTAYGFEWKFVQ